MNTNTNQTVFLSDLPEGVEFTTPETYGTVYTSMQVRSRNGMTVVVYRLDGRLSTMTLPSRVVATLV